MKLSKLAYILGQIDNPNMPNIMIRDINLDGRTLIVKKPSLVTIFCLFQNGSSTARCKDSRGVGPMVVPEGGEDRHTQDFKL